MWPNRQLPADVVTFAEEILKRKLYFLCSEERTTRNIFPYLWHVGELKSNLIFYSHIDNSTRDEINCFPNSLRD